MPRLVAMARSRSDAESVTKTMRATTPSRAALPAGDDTGRIGASGEVPARRHPFRPSRYAWTSDGSFPVGRARRHLHAPLQHGPHGLDAGGLPGPATPARRPVHRADDARPPAFGVLHERARAVAVVRGALRPVRTPPADAP